MAGKPDTDHPSHIRLSTNGGVAAITLDRPEKRNSITLQMLREIEAALDQIEESQSRVLLLSGAGGNFCAGADLDYVAGLIEETPWLFESEFLPQVQHVMNRIEDLRIPVIAVVEGYCLAGGFELMLCCDIVIAAESATIGDGHSVFGFLPGSGGAYRLTRKMGPNAAKYIAFTGKFFSAEEFRRFGLVAEVHGEDDLPARVRELAELLSKRSPIGLKRMKELIHLAEDSDRAGGLAAERLASAAHVASYDMKEGLSAFTEKRKPDFKGR